MYIPGSKYKGHRKNQRKVNKVDDINANDSHEDQDPSFVGTFNSLCAVDHLSNPPIFNSFATQLDSHPLATSEPLMTKVNVEGIGQLKLEVDTAASHNIISEKAFNQIQNDLEKLGKSKSKKLSKGVKIRLADGSVASQECPVVQLNISSDLDKFSNPIALTFLVVKGPNNLVGRHSLARLWPSDFQRFKNSTCSNIVKSSNVGNSANGNINSVNVGKSANKNVNSDKVDYTKSKSNFKTKNPVVKEKSNSNSAKAGVTAKNFPAHDTAHVSRGPHQLHFPSSSSSPKRPPVEPDETCRDSARAWPDRRPLPKLPDEEITQQIGEQYCKQLCNVYHEVFDGGKGTFKGAEATMNLKPGGLEQIKKSGPRPVAKIPYGLEDQFEVHLDKLYEDLEIIDGKDIITASQVVPVIETKNNSRKLKRLAINYKSTINKHLEDIPDIFTTCTEELSKVAGEYRTCIDLTGAYKQVMITDMFSRKILAVVTPRGYAIPNRLMFGVKTAPAIFNANMRKLLHSCNGRGPIVCAQMVDDICLSGSNAKEHFDNLAELLYRLYACGLKANLAKCTFYQNEVKFLGKIVDRDGIRLDTSTTDAILNMPAPNDKSQLRSFLGHISYIAKHIPDLRSARAPLDYLLKPDIKFVWDKSHADAFEKCKKLASNSALLTHFDPSKSLVLTTDASPYGVGACLSHKVVVNNKTRLLPIAYASASLKDAQKNYAQVDREGLGVYWGINHFRQYLLCSDFELHTDCSALVKIFGPKNDMNGCAAGRLSRWAAALMEYSFTIKHIKGSKNCTADSLSRLPVVDQISGTAPFPVVHDASTLGLPSNIKSVINKVEAEILYDVKYLAFNPDTHVTDFTVNAVVGESSTVAAWDLVPLSVKEVAEATKTCKVYGKLYKAVKSGIFDHKDKDISKFQGVFDSLYIENDVIHFGSRIVIPTKFHERLLTELHASHIGVVSMKKVVRDIFWWPGITKSIEHIAAKCEGCRKFKKKPPPNSLSVWPFARRPMERVHIDFFEYKGKHVLLMVDAYSKKIWTQLMNTDTTTSKTLAVLYGWFCTETGTPTTLVSDNGPQFTSHEFARKMKLWGIKHVFSPPYHPSSNGQAERAVQLYKDRLRKMDVSAKLIDLFVALAYIGKVHGLTPHSSTDRCPYELIKKSNLPSLFPSLTSDASKQSELTVTRYCTANLRNRKSFEEGDKVVVYDNHTKLSYPAVVSEILGTNNYLVYSDNGTKHVSGDVMSRAAQPTVAARAPDDADRCHDNTVLVNDDTQSVLSDMSDDLDDYLGSPANNHLIDNIYVDNLVNNPNRPGQRELRNLGPIRVLPDRLRSGRV